MWTSVTSSAMLKLNKDNHHCVLRCIMRAVPKCQRCVAVMFPFGWAQKGEDSCHCTSCLPKDLQAALWTSLTRRSQPSTKSMPDPPKQLYVVLLTKPEALQSAKEHALKSALNYNLHRSQVPLPPAQHNTIEKARSSTPAGGRWRCQRLLNKVIPPRLLLPQQQGTSTPQSWLTSMPLLLMCHSSDNCMPHRSPGHLAIFRASCCHSKRMVWTSSFTASILCNMAVASSLMTWVWVRQVPVHNLFISKLAC
jgi:hypothetical protein